MEFSSLTVPNPNLRRAQTAQPLVNARPQTHHEDIRDLVGGRCTRHAHLDGIEMTSARSSRSSGSEGHRWSYPEHRPSWSRGRSPAHCLADRPGRRRRQRHPSTRASRACRNHPAHATRRHVRVRPPHRRWLPCHNPGCLRRRSPMPQSTGVRATVPSGFNSSMKGAISATNLPA